MTKFRTLFLPSPTTKGGSRRKTPANLPPIKTTRKTVPRSSSSTETTGPICLAILNAVINSSSVFMWILVCRLLEPRVGLTTVMPPFFLISLNIFIPLDKVKQESPLGTGNPARRNLIFITPLLSIHSKLGESPPGRGKPSNTNRLPFGNFAKKILRGFAKNQTSLTKIFLSLAACHMHFARSVSKSDEGFVANLIIFKNESDTNKQ